jgi:hypothetical protein
MERILTENRNEFKPPNWRRSRKGNLCCHRGPFVLTVYPGPSWGFRWCIGSTDKDRTSWCGCVWPLPRFASSSCGSEAEAQAAVVAAAEEMLAFAAELAKEGRRYA